MALSSKVITNIFEVNEPYAKSNFWVAFARDNEDLYYEFRDLCKEEKAEVDIVLTKESRKLSNDERLVFKKYIPKSRLLFVLYIMGLWRPDTKESESVGENTN